MNRRRQGLITSRARILVVIHLDPEASYTEIAGRLRMDEKTVREGIEALVQGGHVIREKRPGKRNRYKINKKAQITPDSEATSYQLAELLALNAYLDIRPPA